MTHFVDLSLANSQRGTENSPGLREGKFVQIKGGSDEYVVFAPKGMCKYHSHIVEQFAALRQIATRTNSTGDTIYLVEQNWEIVGGGKMRINSSEKAIEVGGSSKAYGSFDTSRLGKTLASAFDGYEIIVLS